MEQFTLQLRFNKLSVNIATTIDVLFSGRVQFTYKDKHYTNIT